MLLWRHWTALLWSTKKLELDVLVESSVLREQITFKPDQNKGEGSVVFLQNISRY